MIPFLFSRLLKWFSGISLQTYLILILALSIVFTCILFHNAKQDNKVIQNQKAKIDTLRKDSLVLSTKIQLKNQIIDGLRQDSIRFEATLLTLKVGYYENKQRMLFRVDSTLKANSGGTATQRRNAVLSVFSD